MIIAGIFFVALIVFIGSRREQTTTPSKLVTDKQVKKNKKTPEERMLFVEERMKHEFDFQKNPETGQIPRDEKEKEFQNSLIAKQAAFNSRSTAGVFTSRGPSNLGGRTRGFVIDKTDNTSNTLIAGGVSSGVFRTTDGGSSWSKVSSNDDIHNATAIAQDPRPGFENIWYYATGERLGNSASLGSFYFGNGVWKSEDGGLTWNQISQTDSNFTSFDSRLDIISSLAVSPVTGDLFIGATARVYRYDGMNLVIELDEETSQNATTTDVVIADDGRVYAGFDGRESNNGIWTSPTGNGSWTRIARNGEPTGWSSTGRLVIDVAPSNNDVIYALYANGQSGFIEADLWQYNLATDTWTDYSSKLPDEEGGNLSGNDPFAIQGGYDLVVSVKPDDDNFVVIGGTNAYKIEDITTDDEFVRIGGYVSNQSYGSYAMGGDTHHPDIHSLEFDTNNPNVLFSGTDGGVHKTLDITESTVTWVNLNNNYQTYQYYHVALDPEGSNAVIGGAQDNGTTIGGTDLGLSNNSDMNTWFGGDGVAVGIAQREGNSGPEFQFYYGTQNGNMRTNFPTCCRGIRPNGSSSQFVTYFYLDPNNTDNLYYAGESILYATDDATNITSGSWDQLGALPIAQNIRTIVASPGEYDPSSSYILVGGNSGGLYRVPDPVSVRGNLSTIAEDITPSGADTSSGVITSGIAIHPTNPDIAMVVYSNYGIPSIYITSDVTATNPTWTLVERNLDAHSVRSAAIADIDGEIIYYVGTARGLYSSTDPENSDWELEGTNTIGLAVVSQLIYRHSDKKMLIGTHGNGMFETTIEGTLSADNATKQDLGLSLYPNPAVSELNIRISDVNLLNEAKYEIFDIKGRRVSFGEVENQKINVESLKSGVYIINVMIDERRQSTKFIKQ